MCNYDWNQECIICLKPLSIYGREIGVALIMYIVQVERAIDSPNIELTRTDYKTGSRQPLHYLPSNILLTDEVDMAADENCSTIFYVQCPK